MQCPLCDKNNSKLHCEIQKPFNRKYFLCDECSLVFADPNCLLINEIEKTRYESHQNHIASDGYISFLSKLMDPMRKYINKSMNGLDYGSGPYPMLKNLFSKEDYKISAWDPYFSDDKKILEQKFDFITCCEVVEHFNYPRIDWEKLINLLKSGGILGISTSLIENSHDFSNWHYIRDDTHVSFYSVESLNWIAKKWNLEILYQEKAVILFKLIA